MDKNVKNPYAPNEKGEILYSFKICQELIEIDTNCNNCKCMTRDMEAYTHWMRWHRALAYLEFRRLRKKAFADAEAQPDEKSKNAMFYHARKMRFQFEKVGLLNYGYCEKFKKAISFLPNTCDLNNINCFQNRR